MMRIFVFLLFSWLRHLGLESYFETLILVFLLFIWVHNYGHFFCLLFLIFNSIWTNINVQILNLMTHSSVDFSKFST